MLLFNPLVTLGDDNWDVDNDNNDSYYYYDGCNKLLHNNNDNVDGDVINTRKGKTLTRWLLETYEHEWKLDLAWKKNVCVCETRRE